MEMEIENEVTIATHNGSHVARQHNLRNPKVIAKEDHIDPNVAQGTVLCVNNSFHKRIGHR